MEILDDKFKLNIERAEFNMIDDSANTDFVERLLGCFSLTQEERLRAGIYVGHEGREWIERSSLVIPSQDPE